jgi:arginyl-tRNA--protein-N-Asp/Glu arginylyltransferase
MYQIKDRSTGVEVQKTLTFWGYKDSGQFNVRAGGDTVTASVTVDISPSEVSQLIDQLIYVYNGWVDSGVVDTTKYPDPMMS